MFQAPVSGTASPNLSKTSVGIGSCNIKNMPRRVDKGAKSTHVIFHELIAGDGITVDVLDRLDSGYAARREIRNNPERIGGQGMATAGIVLGWVAIGMLALTIIMFLYLRKIDTGHPIMRETRSTAAIGERQRTAQESFACA